MKNLVITDTDLAQESFNNSIVVNLNNLDYKPCSGGLACLKHQTPCKYIDDMQLIADWVSQCTLIVLVTKVEYGCVGIQMKQFLERCTSNFESNYSIVDQHTKRLNKSDLKKRILLIGYGKTTESERRLLRDYFYIDMFTNNVSSFSTYFCEDDSELTEAIETFGGVDHE